MRRELKREGTDWARVSNSGRSKDGRGRARVGALVSGISQV